MRGGREEYSSWFSRVFKDFLEIPRNSSEFPCKKYKILQILRILEAEGCIFLKFKDETRTRAASNFEDEDEDHKIEEFAHPSGYACRNSS